MLKKIIILCFFILNNLINSTSLGNIQNQIVVKVENEIVTNYEIKNKILSILILSNEEINQNNIDKLKKQALSSIIQNKIKKIEVTKYKIQDDSNQLRTYLKSISSDNILGLQKKFEENNLDFKLFLEEIKIQLKWQKLIYQIYSKKIDLNEESINDDLKNLVQNKTTFKEFKISEIEVSLDNERSDSEIISQIQNLIIKLGFEDVALKHSTSTTSSKKGDLGWVNSHSLSSEIFKALNKIQPGEITLPIKRQNSILFLKLNDIRLSKSENVNIDELRKDLINQKKNELFNLYSNSHLSKLRNSSLIEYK